MKKFVKVCAALMVFVLVFNLDLTAYAAGSVTYDGDANEFIFEPGSEKSPTNLFENFQSVMPGDKLTDQILIKNDTSHGVKIKVYLRSLGSQEGTEEFLSQMNLTVQKMDDTILFEAPANETAQLKGWVYLGTVYSCGEITLDVTLEVPITMGEEFQDQTGYIDWQFLIEELPVQSSDPKPPATGDNNDIMLYVWLTLFSLSLIIIVVVGKLREREEYE